MLSRVKNFLRFRAVKFILHVALVLLVYTSFKVYTQRNLIQGPAPQLDGASLKSRPFNIRSFAGQPVLLHFWATWCPVCKLEQDNISSLSRNHAVVTVALNSGSRSEVSRYLEEHHLDFPVLVDEDGRIAERYGVQGVPTSFFIDAGGNIAFTEVGYTTYWGLLFRFWMAGN